MPDPTLTADELAHFHGSDQIFRHPMMRQYVYTEGVQYVARRAGAYWLLDAIFSHQHDPKVRAEPFQLWKLAVDGSAATLSCTDGDDTTPLVVQHIEYTDFPLAEIELYLENNVLMLPSER